MSFGTVLRARCVDGCCTRPWTVTAHSSSRGRDIQPASARPLAIRLEARPPIWAVCTIAYRELAVPTAIGRLLGPTGEIESWSARQLATPEFNLPSSRVGIVPGALGLLEGGGERTATFLSVLLKSPVDVAVHALLEDRLCDLGPAGGAE